jgi:hypothetical protein
MAVPGAITNPVATAGDNTLSIAFTAPTATPAVTGYKYQIDSKGGWKAFTASPLALSGLKNGREYTVAILAVNADGDGPAEFATGTPTDSNAANDNGFDDASWAANPGAPVPHLDYNDPDD